MASKMKVTFPGGIEVADCYTLVTSVAIDRVQRRVAFQLAAFRSEDARRALAAALGDVQSKNEALTGARRKLEAAARVPASEDAKANVDRNSAIGRAQIDHNVAEQELRIASQAAGDVKLQPCWTSQQLQLSPAASEAALQAGDLDGLITRIYEELKSTGGPLENTEDVLGAPKPAGRKRK